MSKVYIQNKIKQIESESIFTLRCTFLIPKIRVSLMKYYKKQLEINRTEDLILYFIKLLEKRRIRPHRNISKHTALYQDLELNLQKHGFTCDPMVWHKWKRMANFLGVSMCYLFAECLDIMSSRGVSKESDGVPTDSLVFAAQTCFEYTNFSKYRSRRWMKTVQRIKK